MSQSSDHTSPPVVHRDSENRVSTAVGEQQPTRASDTKRERLDYPSGFFYLARFEATLLIIDALVDEEPGSKWSKSGLSRKSGVTRKTVHEHIDRLVEVDLLEEVGELPQYRRTENELWQHIESICEDIVSIVEE